jgi:hypothetical protein
MVVMAHRHMHLGPLGPIACKCMLLRVVVAAFVGVWMVSSLDRRAMDPMMC